MGQQPGELGSQRVPRVWSTRWEGSLWLHISGMTTSSSGMYAWFPPKLRKRIGGTGFAAYRGPAKRGV